MCLHAAVRCNGSTFAERKKSNHTKCGWLQPYPTDPAENTAGAPLIEMLNEIEGDIGFEVTIHKHIKPGSGIGSSAASAAGAVVAANHLLDGKFSK